MEWRDDGIVLAARRHGESAAVVSLLTAAHGRHAGLVRGGAGKAGRAVLQPGNLVSCAWKARLEDHLGLYTCELIDANAAALLADAGRLAALTAACAVLEATLAEREPQAPIYDATLALLAALRLPDGQDEAPPWPETYVRWELVVLADLGFGLDLTACAVTGAEEGLCWVSPRTGRAVSAEAGRPYAGKLLPLPGFLGATAGDGAAAAGDLADGLRLTGYFLDRHVLRPRGQSLPAARQRLSEWLG
jgi:DNA repair protein RecO (recombination protein O)